MRLILPVLGLLAALIAAAPLVGCGGKSDPDTPEAVAQAFADAMAGGNAAQAAELWGYVTEARKGNPDWDGFPPGQRSQIVSKMKDAKEGELQAQTGQFAGGMKAGSAAVSGTSATVRLQGATKASVVVRLEQADGQWRVVGFGPVTGLQ